VPLGTVVRDVYSDGERREIYDALEMLVRGDWWNNAGVYCFWDPETRDPLYIGVASNLPERFAQHNSLKWHRPNRGNKGKQINEWFAGHRRLGVSVVLQEGLADELYEPYSRNAEGQLLEGYRQAHGRLPAWNGVGGSRVGAGYARGNSAAWVDFATGAQDGLVVARRTIRALDDDSGAEYNECTIHPARTALMHVGPIGDQEILGALDHLLHYMPEPLSAGESLEHRLKLYLSQPAPHPERGTSGDRPLPHCAER